MVKNPPANTGDGGDVSEPLDPIFVVVSCCSFLSQPRRAHSRDLIDFAGWHRQRPAQGDQQLETPAEWASLTQVLGYPASLLVLMEDI